MAPERHLLPDLPECDKGCERRTFRKDKVSKNNICTDELKVAAVINQIVSCNTCRQEFSYPISAKEH